MGAPSVVTIEIRRAYEPPGEADGYRALVDRVWPRGLSRAKLHIEEWLPEVAPSTELRHWFGHETARWPEFHDRYLVELANPDQVAALRALLARAGERTLTLVYGARDEEHNQAVVLSEVLRGLAK